MCVILHNPIPPYLFRESKQTVKKLESSKINALYKNVYRIWVCCMVVVSRVVVVVLVVVRLLGQWRNSLLSFSSFFKIISLAAPELPQSENPFVTLTVNYQCSHSWLQTRYFICLHGCMSIVWPLLINYDIRVVTKPSVKWDWAIFVIVVIVLLWC